MIWLDYVLIIIIALSALYGFFRGIVREILSLIGWVVSFWVALKFSHKLTGLFDGMFSNEGLLYGVSFVALLLITLIAFTIVSMIIGRFVKLTGLGLVDRGIGAVFGIGRGVLIVAALVFFGNMTPLAAGEAWNQSALIGPFKEFATWATDFRSKDANKILPPVDEL
jgi:membrane protein required for colicin V production